MVFIHGWLDNSASFLSTLAEIHQRHPDLHLLAIDLPGHGCSFHKSSDNFYPFHDYIDDLNQVLLYISPNKPVLIGHSLGALIASCYSAAFPEKVSGLVQIEGYGPLSESPQNSVSRLRQGVLSRQRQRRKPSRPLTSFEDALALRVKANQLPAELLSPIVKRATNYDGKQWQWRHDAKLKCDSLYRMSRPHAEAILAAITCPNLVILGDQGYERLREESQYVANMQQIEVISGGHHCHLQQPKLVAELILGLVNKI